MIRQTGEEAEAKRRCCEQSFLASVAGLQKEGGAAAAGPFRRGLGLFLLAGVHLHLLLWSALVSVFRPRYRPVVRFQLGYFRDVLAREFRHGSLFNARPRPRRARG